MWAQKGVTGGNDQAGSQASAGPTGAGIAMETAHPHPQMLLRRGTRVGRMASSLGLPLPQPS